MDQPTPRERGTARAEVAVGISEGDSVWDTGRRLLSSQPLPAGPLVAVELSDDPTTARVHVCADRYAEPAESERVPMGCLTDTVLRHAPAGAILHLSAERALADCVRRVVAAWVAAGVHVALIGDDRQVRDAALIKFAGLHPRVELGHCSSRETVWSVLTDLVGDILVPHRGLIENVVANNATLALLLATALEPWLGQDAVPAQVIDDALSTALARHIRVLAENDTEQAFAFVTVIVGARPALRSAAGSLELCPERAQELRHALIGAGFGGNNPRRRELAVTGLIRQLPRSTTKLAVATLCEILVHADLDTETCVEVLEALHLEAGQDFVRLVHDTVTSVPPHHRQELLDCLLPALARGSDDPVRTVAAEVSARRVDALRIPILAAGENEQLSDPLDGGSLLVSLEHPAAVAAWAGRVLADPQVDDATWSRAAMARSVAGLSGGPRRDRLSADRRDRLAPAPARLLDVVRISMSAFTMLASEEEILGVAAQAVDLELEGFPTDVGCLIAVACLAVDDFDLADRWSWLVRAQSEPTSLDHGCAQLIKAYCELARGHFGRAWDNADAAWKTLDRLGAVALASVAAAISSLCDAGGGRTRPPPIPSDANAVLVGVHHFFAARLAMEDDDGLDVVNVLFEVGRRLRLAGLSNPGLLSWREQLVRIFEGKGELQIAECLRTDLLRAEAQWAAVNPRSAAVRRERSGLAVAPVRAADARGLDAVSASEMRVVERVVAGDTNPEAATALFLSKRTVDTHLRNVYRRLGINSREELRALMATRALCSQDSAEEGAADRAERDLDPGEHRTDADSRSTK